MKDIELLPLPDADVYTSTALIGYRYSYSAILMQSYARAAVEADRAQRVPDGWKLVPVEPTPDMCAAAFEQQKYDHRRGTITLASNCYRAMLDTAPMLAATPARPAQQELEKALEPRMSRACLDAWDKSSFTAGSHDAVHPMFLEAFSAGFKASAQHQEPPQPVERKPMTDAASDVLAERQRQISAEGWTPEHDDEHAKGEMAAAAACYALHTEPVGNVGDYLRFWPWAAKWWKPADSRHNLVKAGALIIAEIERLDRAAERHHGIRE